MYAGLFLTGRALEQFKPYFIKIQTNRITTINQEVRYIFLSQEGFADQLIQIYSNLEVVMIVKQKFSEFIQKGSATEYIIIF